LKIEINNNSLARYKLPKLPKKKRKILIDLKFQYMIEEILGEIKYIPLKRAPRTGIFTHEF
jgi:hypothetical protein